MKKILGRLLVVVPALALQFVWFYISFMILNEITYGHVKDIIDFIFSFLAVIFVIALVAKRDESTYKLLWVIFIMTFPIMGAIFYFAFGNKRTGKELKKKLLVSSGALPSLYGNFKEKSSGYLKEIGNENPRLAQTLSFLSSNTSFPLMKNEVAKYYPFGEDMFADMCEELKKAKHYIYVEYFIIQSGKFWGTMSEIMAERAAAGVDVRVMYDDLGSIATYSMKEVKELSHKGIKCIPFNPFFLLKSQLNNRDHRKIMVIDGEVAFSGGVNLADEYINEIHPFGRWKDIGFMVKGDAVYSYAYMFVEFWNAFSNDKIPSVSLNPADGTEKEAEGDGYALPYYDSPMRDEHTSNILFVETLSTATGYVWFYTPYLMLGDALYDAFIRAARRGVDVRIIMPGIPDKKMVFRLSRSYYEDLLKAGVRIFEYSPGFVHAKAFISDDIVAGIGTVNLDYRSLFLHFECNSVFYKAGIISDLKKDFELTQNESREIRLEDTKRGPIQKFIDNLLRLIAPLL